MARARKEFRELTVSEATHYGRKTAPMLRIQGLWLQELGVNIGDPVLLGEKKSYDASMESLERLRKKHEGLREQLSEAEDKVREYDRMKVHESFPVMRLTAELLDEYVEDIEILPKNEVRINWK